MRHADGGSAVSNTPAEFVDGLGLVQPGEAHMIVGAVDSDVLLLVFVKGGHQFVEVFLATGFTQVGSGEVGVHAGAVPVRGTEWFAVVFHVNAVFLTDALEDVAGDPHLIGGPLGALAEDLEFPLALGHFSIDAFVIDSSVQTDVEVFLHNLAGDVPDVLIADPGVIRTLGSRVAVFGESEGSSFLVEEIFLFKAEP